MKVAEKWFNFLLIGIYGEINPIRTRSGLLLHNHLDESPKFKQRIHHQNLFLGNNKCNWGSELAFRQLEVITRAKMEAK